MLSRAAVALVALSLAGPAHALGLTIIQEDLSSFARDDLLDAKCYHADADGREGLRVTVAGRCVSSCALCRPRNPLFCSAPNTELWFHSSPNGVQWNDHILSVTTPRLRSWIAARGGLRPTYWGWGDPNWLVLKGQELFNLIPLCSEWTANARTGPQTTVSVPALSDARRGRNAASEALIRLQRHPGPVGPVLPPSGSWPSRTR